MTHRSAAEVLARAAATTRYEDAPEAVRRRVRFLVADVLAVALSACERPEIASVRALTGLGGSSGATPGSGGPASVIGTGDGAPPEVAAWLNGLPIAAEQLQDGHREARGHPASHVVPAVLAVAEAIGATGEDALSAILAGYEVGTRVGMAMGGTPEGVHDIATWGAVAAAAGVAHLRTRGSDAAVAAAVELAASLPVLPDAAVVFDGWSGQHVFLGLGAQLGVTLGTAAAAGLEAAPGTLERHFGRISARAFDATIVEDAVDADGRWREHAVLTGYIKRHPTCAHLHGVNDAVEDLLGSAGGPLPEARSVLVETYAAAAVFDDPAPRNDLAARFSIPWTVAQALVRGRLDAREVTAAALEDRQVADLARRVEVRHAPALDRGYPAGRPAVVTVDPGSGSSLVARADVPRGDGPNALTDPAVAAKPRQLLEASAGASWTSELLDAVEGLAAQGLAPLTAVLRRVPHRRPSSP